MPCWKRLSANSGSAVGKPRSVGASINRTLYRLLQDVLVKTYARWSRIRGSPDAYVRHGLLNAARTHWRRRQREELRVEPPDRATENPDTERIDQVARALASLTRRERQVLVLCCWGDPTEQQTAAELGLARGTCR